MLSHFLRIVAARAQVLYDMEKERKGDLYNVHRHLVHCCAMDDIYMCQYLLCQRGANPNYELTHEDTVGKEVMFREGDTPLKVAARFENPGVIAFIAAFIEEESASAEGRQSWVNSAMPHMSPLHVVLGNRQSESGPEVSPNVNMYRMIPDKGEAESSSNSSGSIMASSAPTPVSPIRAMSSVSNLRVSARRPPSQASRDIPDDILKENKVGDDEEFFPDLSSMFSNRKASTEVVKHSDTYYSTPKSKREKQEEDSKREVKQDEAKASEEQTMQDDSEVGEPRQRAHAQRRRPRQSRRRSLRGGMWE